jgi:Fic family protein
MQDTPGACKTSVEIRDDTTKEQVYEAPPAEMVPSLIDALLLELNESERKGVPNVVRAAMAHLT